MNTETNIKLVAFPPGSLIELDDPMTGNRRLAMVCSTGTEFVDYIDNDNPPTAFAILDVLDPVKCDDLNDQAANLMMTASYDVYKSFSNLIIALCDTEACEDPLTLNRAGKWALETGSRDVEQVAYAGRLATLAARARQKAISVTAASWIATGAV